MWQYWLALIAKKIYYGIKPMRLQELADLIVQVFPTEDKSTYYIP